MTFPAHSIHRIKTMDDPHFQAAHHIYTTSFPVHEQRNTEDIPAALELEEFHYDVFLAPEDDSLLAILCYWMTDEFIYLEHFAVNPEKRNGGLGKIILDTLKSKGKGKLPVILEIDPPEDEISIRRLGFYQRSGFASNEQFDYIHPPYDPSGFPYPLLVMSFPHKLEKPLYRKFESYHHTTVINPGGANAEKK